MVRITASWRKIPEEAGDQHEVAECEFIAELGNPCGDRIRAADDGYFAEPALGFELFFRRNPPFHLLAAAAVAGGQLLRRRQGSLVSRRIAFADDHETADRHLRDIAAGISEGADTAADASDRLLAALEQGQTAPAEPGRRILAIGRDINRRIRLLEAFRLD